MPAVTAAPAFLRLRSVRNASVVARPEMLDFSGGAGVVRATRAGPRPVRDTGIRRLGRDQVRPPRHDPGEPVAHLDAAVYGGLLFDHFGHFLLESTARLWPRDLDPEVPVVWIAGWTDTLAPWMHEVLDEMGVGARRLVVDASGPVGVDELLVADAGFEFGRWMHPWFAAALASRPAHPGAGDHVWLSRSDRVPHSGLDEEVELEQRLAAEGWTVVHPERLSVHEQLDVLAGAVHVAGLEGSAFHALCLVRGSTAAVDLFTRHGHENFEIAAAVCGLRQRRCTLPGARSVERAKDRGTDVQWSGVDIDAAVGLLHERCRHEGHVPARDGVNRQPVTP